MSESRAGGHGRLLTGAVWAVVLLALWLWGREITDGPGSSATPTAGDVAAAGRPLAEPLPPAHVPLPPVRPRALAIKALDVNAPVEERGLDRLGAVDPPPYARAGTVGWYRSGPPPGSPGAAVLVGHVDTDNAPAVFYDLGSLRPGETLTVRRADGTTAEFTVEDVSVFTKDRFDAAKAYGPRDAKRAELRLITCGGDYDRDRRSYSANVVVSAYLTGTGRS
ncbi:class F sortase [Streptomyces hiroshimensis]|uniref:Class F sortase n=1 Tax=Streptomyces hiroshimensis TaxID=66424 RepID=A0ABQ2Y8E9_9ACTN|nr:class F sortase [Streptomyces hiroshimensis]GGX69218.1 class F sortase [Streptomyces hiroshimensis]